MTGKILHRPRSEAANRELSRFSRLPTPGLLVVLLCPGHSENLKRRPYGWHTLYVCRNINIQNITRLLLRFLTKLARPHAATHNSNKMGFYSVIWLNPTLCVCVCVCVWFIWPVYLCLKTTSGCLVDSSFRPADVKQKITLLGVEMATPKKLCPFCFPSTAEKQ